MLGMRSSWFLRISVSKGDGVLARGLRPMPCHWCFQGKFAVKKIGENFGDTFLYFGEAEELGGSHCHLKVLRCDN